MNVCIIEARKRPVSATFIDAQCRRLPAKVTSLYGRKAFRHGERFFLYQNLVDRFLRVVSRGELRSSNHDDETRSYIRAFRRFQTDIAVAQYGTVGVRVMHACQELGIPLIVHFRGYDASVEELLEQHRFTYPQLFQAADALIAVSHQIEEWLLDSGAPRAKVHYNPSGVDCHRFQAANPAESAPTFLHVGRFVEKKAPHLLLKSFEQVLRHCPEARLRMIGSGQMLGQCRELAATLGIHSAVTFLGSQEHDRVRAEMSHCRALLQHSLRAPNGDTEGTPNSIMEAGASGLPVVSTRHAGIPDVVIEGETGFLVDEGDVDAMARHIVTLVRDPKLAASMGHAARQRIINHFSLERSIAKLCQVIEGCAKHHRLSA